MTVMYSMLGGCFGETTKLGPLAKTDLCVLVKGLLEKVDNPLGVRFLSGRRTLGNVMPIGKGGRPCFLGTSAASLL